jgi:hypothetical protein
MAQNSWPWENIDTTETQFSQWARNIGEGISPGVLDDLEPFGDSSGLIVKVRAGAAIVRGHYYRSTALESVPVAAPDLVNPRIDNLVLELDPVENSILLKMVAGTPAPSPEPPALVQTDSAIYQQLLAEVTVSAAATTISAADVKNKSQMISKGGESTLSNTFLLMGA